ncbi:hypothetical protein ASPZODRAFT_2105078 [Penicilliopsis zonata CBS 506.65]|uniref:Major facilitator superfamily (MFS) profile domain-containing protein n=1 Tax=Penicilliopsis zonata CBS 506.65 TaxID=1073090 RepID=A0A1L9SUJ7_9EURO|nr:hypothetical protein ASPZODRAFT_2105078 [Penicilliopsis zonata CBS 506.65]OJJ50733.1 hypothetical protein ASPZODRAFT_2105078 [Penicilliopsis zonata CBS 506.65]
MERERYEGAGGESLSPDSSAKKQSSTRSTEDSSANLADTEESSGHESASLTTDQEQEGSSRLEEDERQAINRPEAESNGPKSSTPIQWDGPDDRDNPMNFSVRKKWRITMMLAAMTFCVTFASSVFSSATRATSRHFHVSPEVMVLGVSLFVLGFSFGPLFFGPLSELYGRRNPLLIGYFIFAIFQIPVAVAQNLQTIFLCRFFGGLFGSAPLAIAGGALADIFNPVDRGVAMAAFAGATFIGPVAGPVVGSFITTSKLGWRWTEYITTIMAFLFGAMGLFLLPETYAPVLLSQRAKKLRYQTRDWAIHASVDEQETDLEHLVHKYLFRPFLMLVLEPILLLITLYMGFVYGFLYLSLQSFEIAFHERRGWKLGIASLPFLAITCGVFMGCAIIIVLTKTRYRRKMNQNGGSVPEERLVPMMIGGFLLPAGMFWFAWTSDPHINWVPQVLSAVLLGAGILLIFLQGLNYIIDVYVGHSNSALAANTLFRSLLGAGFPMFGIGMFHNLGVNWAMTLLGCLTTALFPVPILFYIYGKKIRSWSRFTNGNSP